ncbi:MAG: serine/threonine-protein kinase [Nodosilinea sp.]
MRRSHYRLLGPVGHGQYGRVYCAIHRKTGELVALKDLDRDRFPTHSFLRELRFLISLKHPNIVTCRALEHSPSGRQLVLDYCEGGTLRGLLDSDVALTLGEVLGFGLDILAALALAHQQGIVHCDVKPENILLQLTPGGWVARISDFGISRLSQETSASEMGHTGSPAYMAPERFYNQHPMASDLYAVGIILYELLLGRRPFSGTPQELMVAHLNQPPEIPDEIPAPIREILLKSLQKLLPRRFQNAGAMQAELQKAHDNLITSQHFSSLAGQLSDQVILPFPDFPSVTVPHPIEVMGLAPLSVQVEQPDNNAAPEDSVHLLMACSQFNVWFYHWPYGPIASPESTQGFALPAPIQQFMAIPQGGVLVTPSSLHLLSMTHGLGRIAHCEGTLGAAVAPNGRWFATYTTTTFTTATGDRCQSEILIRQLTLDAGSPVKISTPKQVPITTQEGEFVSILSLDNGHMALVLRQSGRTIFHIVARRGHHLGCLSAAILIHSLVPTTRPYRYLGLEASSPEALLVIDLKPFRIVRYRVGVVPRWVFETPVGYGVVSQTGDCILVNAEGQITHRLAGLPSPTALVCLSPAQYLWSVPEGKGSRIYTVDLGQIGLNWGD